MNQPEKKEKDNSKRPSVWNTLNTPIVLLLLSGVILVAIKGFYKSYTDNAEEHTKTEQHMIRLYGEIDKRNEIIRKLAEKCSDEDIRNIKASFYGSRDDTSVYDFNIYEEFKPKTIYALYEDMLTTLEAYEQQEHKINHPNKLIPFMNKKENSEFSDTALPRIVKRIKSFEHFLPLLQKRPVIKTRILGSDQYAYYRQISGMDSVYLSRLLQKETPDAPPDTSAAVTDTVKQF